MGFDRAGQVDRGGTGGNDDDAIADVEGCASARQFGDGEAKCMQIRNAHEARCPGGYRKHEVVAECSYCTLLDRAAIAADPSCDRRELWKVFPPPGGLRTGSPWHVVAASPQH